MLGAFSFYIKTSKNRANLNDLPEFGAVDRNLPFPQAEPRQGVEIRDVFFEKNESSQAVFLA